MDSETLSVQDLDLPDDVIRFYMDSGIKELYPPQSDAIRQGLLQKKNTLAAISTASGKTLLAELAMLKSIIEDGGKALYIVPLVALASEKYDRFLQFASLGVSVGISTGDFSSKKRGEKLGDHDIVVVTSEKADSLMRNQTEWMHGISVVVIDEVHLLGDASRGTTLDITITKLRLLNPKAQIIALSATIGNASDVADWLDAELVVSDWRPIDLVEGVGFESGIVFENPPNKKIDHRTDSDTSVNIVLDTIEAGGQCLVFRSRRNFCAAFAKKFVDKKKVNGELNSLLGGKRRRELQRLANKVAETSESETADTLAACIRHGVAFHHAGLTSKQRRFVEDGFRQNKILMLASTTTLAAGLNLPARQVIIKEYKRYDGVTSSPIPVLEYKQMAGRAGRPHLDDHGDSALIAKSDDELQTLLTTYVGGTPENIFSDLNREGVMRTHVLASITTGFALTHDGLLNLFSRTFCGYHTDIQQMDKTVRDCVGFLLAYNMISLPKDQLIESLEDQSLEEYPFTSTPLGELVSKLYIDPLTAATIIDGFKRARLKGMDVTDLTILQLICTTKDVPTRPPKMNRNMLGEYIFKHADEFINIPIGVEEIIKGMRGGSVMKPLVEIDDYFTESVAYAYLLMDWTNEMKLSSRKKDDDDELTKRRTITGKFGVYEGDVYGFRSSVEWVTHAAGEIANLIDMPTTVQNQTWVLELRIRYGIKAELLDLIKVRHIGRAYARQLFDRGVKTHKNIQNNIPVLQDILGDKITKKVLNGLHIPYNLSLTPINEDTPYKYQATIQDFNTPSDKEMI